MWCRLKRNLLRQHTSTSALKSCGSIANSRENNTCSRETDINSNELDVASSTIALCCRRSEYVASMSRVPDRSPVKNRQTNSSITQREQNELAKQSASMGKHAFVSKKINAVTELESGSSNSEHILALMSTNKTKGDRWATAESDSEIPRVEEIGKVIRIIPHCGNKFIENNLNNFDENTENDPRIGQKLKTFSATTTVTTSSYHSEVSGSTLSRTSTFVRRSLSTPPTCPGHGTGRVSPPRMKRRKKTTLSGEMSELSRKSRISSCYPDNSTLHVKSSEVIREKRTPPLPMHAEEISENKSISTSTSIKNRAILSDDDTVSSTKTACAGLRSKVSLSQTPQSSPDFISDDADGKDSGYITLEDLQAQIGRASWSSDERQTDFDLSSADDCKPDSSGKSNHSKDLALLPASMSTWSADDELWGAVDRSDAQSDAASSLLKFTFTVKLDSKMFRRRIQQQTDNCVDEVDAGLSSAGTARDDEQLDVPCKEHDAALLSHSTVVAGKVDVVRKKKKVPTATLR